MNFKQLFVLFSLAISSQAAFSKTLIVSDVDDTIKMTDVLNRKPIVFYNGLLRKKAFSGMSELYAEFDKNPDVVIHYVSGSPQYIRFRLNTFLKYNEFPQGENLTLKKRMRLDTIDYKVGSIRNIIKKENPDKIILIGDDTEHDPEIYETIQKENPEKVESIYIRSVQNRDLPKLSIMKGFFAAPEIAAHEMVKGAMDAKALSNVANGFIYKSNNSGISLNKRYCPTQGSAEIDKLETQISDSEALAVLSQVQRKIKNTCMIKSANIQALEQIQEDEQVLNVAEEIN